MVGTAGECETTRVADIEDLALDNDISRPESHGSVVQHNRKKMAMLKGPANKDPDEIQDSFIPGRLNILYDSRRMTYFI